MTLAEIEIEVSYDHSPEAHARHMAVLAYIARRIDARDAAAQALNRDVTPNAAPEGVSGLQPAA